MPELFGVPRGKVILSDYTESWGKYFEEEKLRLLTNLAGEICSVEHIGSTAIVGMKSKPIIDIAIIVKNKEETKIKKMFESIGYEYVDDGVGNERLYFVLRKEEISYFHLHVYTHEANQTYVNQIFFRDYLNSNRELREEYEALKIGLFQEYANERSAYTSNKNGFIQRILNDK